MAAGRPIHDSRPPHGPRDPALREARSCYRHLAGARGVQLYDALMVAGCLRHQEGSLVLTETGAAFAARFGVDIAAKGSRAPLCRDCLDWTERRPHLGGRLGRALLAQMIETGWAVQDAGSRTVRFTESGRAAFDRAFPPGPPAGQA